MEKTILRVFDKNAFPWLVGRSITIGFSELQYKVIGISTWSCRFYKNLVVPYCTCIAETFLEIFQGVGKELKKHQI